jgi:hypothetical protein
MIWEDRGESYLHHQRGVGDGGGDPLLPGVDLVPDFFVSFALEFPRCLPHFLLAPCSKSSPNLPTMTYPHSMLAFSIFSCSFPVFLSPS